MSINFKTLNNSNLLGLDSQLTFGKYIGRTLKEIISINPGYIHWIVQNTKLDIAEEVFDYLDELQYRKDNDFRTLDYDDYDLLGFPYEDIPF